MEAGSTDGETEAAVTVAVEETAEVPDAGRFARV
jgi:hypothetical protein